MMKLKLMISILLLIIGSNQLIAQCVNNVSTNPNNPTNNSLPDVGSMTPYNYDQRYLNGFDWWTPNQYVLNNMQYNPNQPYGNMSNIQSAIILNDYNYLNKALGAEEMTPQNGWELLLSNLGYYPDNVTPHNYNDIQTTPYLVFYNRYKGTVRVFVQYGYNQPPSGSINGVKINLKYKEPQVGNLSGIFRLAEGIDKSLDQTTSVSIVSAVAPRNGATNFWMSGDFQLTYDPCVCFYPTNITLDFEFFSTTDFKLKGIGITVEEDIIDGNGNIVNADFLSGVDFSTDTDAENGFIIYKNMEKLADDYITEMEIFKDELDAVGAYNEEVEKKLAIIKVFKVVVSLGLTAATGDPTMVTLALKAPSLVFSADSADQANRKLFFKAVEKILGKELDTYISDNFKKKPNPEKPTMPTASFTEMYFEGQLEQKLVIGGPLFSTPGSFVNNDNPNDFLNEPTGQNVYGYPIYNEALGQFALLKKPKLLISNIITDSLRLLDYSHTSTWLDGNDIDFYFSTKKWLNTLQFKLDENLVYYFNPSIDYREKEVQVSLVFDLILLQDTIGNIHDSISLNDTYYKANIQSSYFNVNQMDTLKFDTLKISSPFVPVDAFNGLTGSFGIKNKKVSLLTEPAAFNDYLSGIPVENYNYIQIKSIQLKILVDMEFETLRDDGSPNATTEIFTYDIDLVDDVTYQNNLLASAYDLNFLDYEDPQLPFDWYFGNTHFNGQTVTGCGLNGNKYRCLATNTITIEGDITTGNGYCVDFVAGNEIYVIGESNISPESVLMIQENPIYDYSNPMPPVTVSYINNYCDKNNQDSPYAANTPSTRLLSIAENQNSETENSRKINNVTYQDIDFNLFPNPTTNSTTIVVNDIRSESLTIKLMDVSGKQINVNIEQQNGNSYVLDVNHLEAGIYFVTVSTFGGSKTKRLVVQ